MGSLFPPRHVYFPSVPHHTSTIIFLHGRGSSGPELTSDLSTLSLSADFSSSTTTSTTQRQKKPKTVFEHFPACRWVFPSARTKWSERFQERLCEWFDSDGADASVSLSMREGEGPGAGEGEAERAAGSSTPLPSSSLPPTTTGSSSISTEELPGLKASVEYILRIIEEEIARLNGDASRVVLCGLSQGMALGLAVLICAVARGIRLGGFVGAMGWFPMAARVTGTLDQIDLNTADRMSDAGAGAGAGLNDGTSNTDLAEARIRAIQQMIISNDTRPLERNNHTHTHPYNNDNHIPHQGQTHPQQRMQQGHELQTPLTVNTPSLPYDVPIFLSHGGDDAWVDVSLGREAYDILQRLGFTNLSWETYTGADVQGHWLKEPEQGDAIVGFLRDVLPFSQGSSKK